MYTQTFIHSQRTLRHILALPTTQAYRHDIIIQRSPAARRKNANGC